MTSITMSAEEVSHLRPREESETTMTWMHPADVPTAAVLQLLKEDYVVLRCTYRDLEKASRWEKIGPQSAICVGQHSGKIFMVDILLQKQPLAAQLNVLADQLETYARSQPRKNRELNAILVSRLVRRIIEKLTFTITTE